MKTQPEQENEVLNLRTIAKEYADEDKARGLLERMLWPNGPVCPHCKNHTEKAIYKLQPAKESKSPARKGVYKCGACRKQFTVTVNTVFEGSHIPISTWLMAIFIMCASKKSVSAKQMERMLGVTYKTAWFLCHRLRFAMTPNHWAEPKLKGTVEVDETWVGGKGDIRTRYQKQTPVVALVERDGIPIAIVTRGVDLRFLLPSSCLRACSEIESYAILISATLIGFGKDIKPRRKNRPGPRNRVTSPTGSPLALG